MAKESKFRIGRSANRKREHAAYSCLRYYATNRKVEGSIPDEVTETFLIYLVLPATLRKSGFTQLLTEMNTSQCFWGVKRGLYAVA
jgi:hypothetical protein